MRVYLKNIIFMMKNWWKWDKYGYLYAFIKILSSILMPIFLALIFKFFLDYIKNGEYEIKYMFWLIISLALTAITYTLDKYSEENISISSDVVKSYYRIDYIKKLITLDIKFIENPNNIDTVKKALEFSRAGRNSSCGLFCKSFTSLISTILGVFTYLSIVFTIEPILVFVILIVSIIDCILNYYIQKINKNSFESSISLWNKIDYYFDKSNELIFSREIHLFNYSENIARFLNEYNAKLNSIMKDFLKKCAQINYIRAFSFFFRNITIYFFMIYKLKNNFISESDLVFTITLITGFSSWLVDIINQINNISIISYSCDFYRNFIKPDFGTLKEKNYIKKDIKHIESIVFSNVSFSYNNKKILDNVSFKIKQGEHIALVGENGAGKSTIIKLLCGFYYPESGEICINNINIKNINIISLRNCISSVFQNYFFYPTTVKKNILLSNDKTNIDLVELARENNIIKFVDNELLEKQINIDGITKGGDFSGGEAQKLLYLRMIVHSGSLLLLDEPTAALDPISEYEFYKSINDVSANKTTIFISHRLISTEFCDRIILIENGKIIEEGKKEELINNNGAYQKMLTAQSYYYKFDKVEK